MKTEEIVARLAAATPGPWYATYSLGCHVWGDAPPNGGDCSVAEWLSEEDATFIAHAPADIAALLSYVEELQARVAGLQGDLAEQEVAKLKLLQEIDIYSRYTNRDAKGQIEEMQALRADVRRKVSVGVGVAALRVARQYYRLDELLAQGDELQRHLEATEAAYWRLADESSRHQAV